VSIFGKPLKDVNEADLKSLVAREERERHTLEFKRDAYAKGDDAKYEMLKDIAAMANAYGGQILLGIDESGDGVASEIVGVADGEREAQSIMSSCLSSIDERIRGLTTHPVSLSNGKHVVIIHIPQSLRAPHMVTYKGRNQFWCRHDRQKNPMSTDEIRDACVRVEMLTAKLQEYLQKRLATVEQFADRKPTLTFSLTPILVQKEVVQTRDMILRKLMQSSALGTGHLPRPCITGLEDAGSPGFRVRLDRNGHLDVWQDLSDSIGRSPGNPPIQFLPSGDLIYTIFHLCALGKAIFERCGIMEPVIAKVDLWYIKDLFLRGKPGGFPSDAHPWRTENANLDALEIENLQDPKAAALRILERVWEAFGFDEGPKLQLSGV
jgi:hypothetical protein